MQSQTFNLPAEMNNVVSATIADTANGDILFCHDQAFLYAAKISKVGGSVIFQRFNLPNLVKLIPVIKNYFIALFTNNKLVVFEVWFNEENKVMLKYVFNKVDKPCVSFFLREVVENMAELQLLYPENQVYIYQFTVNGKVGHMEYVIGPQNKIKAERAQLYGSKTICCPQRKLFYYFTNFSSKIINCINLSKLENELCEQMKTTLLAYICLPKIEEHYLILGNLNVVNLNNPGNRHRIQIAEEFQQDFSRLLQKKNKPTFRINTYFDMLLIQDSELMMAAIIQIKQKGSCLIAVEYGNFNWFWTSTRKLVGFSPTRNSFRMIDSLKMNHRSNFMHDETASQQQVRANSLKQFKSQQNFIFKQDNNEDLSKKWKEYTQKIMSDTNLPIKFIQNLKESCAKSPDKPQSQHSEPTKNIHEDLSFIQKVSLPEKFVPNKIIQKKGVNVSKSINKPKQIEPIPKTETSFPASAQTPENKDKNMPVQAPSSVPIQEQVQVQAEIEQKKEEPKVENENFQKKTQENNQQPCGLQEKSKSEQSKPDAADKCEQKVQQSKSEEVMSRQQSQILSIIESKTPIKQQNTESKPQSQINLSKAEVHRECQQSKGERGNKQNSQADEKDIKDNEDAGYREIQKQLKKRGGQEDSIQKNLALIIQRNMAGLENSASNINRNKIFNNQAPLPIVPPPQLKIKQTQSQNLQYYNPLLAHSPLSQKQLEDDPKEPYNIEISPQEEQQQHNEEVLTKIKELFESTNVRLLKTLEDISTTSTLEPYLKERVREEIQDRVMGTLRKEIAGPFTKNLQGFFNEIFRQTSSVQEESIKFYKEAAVHKSGLIEVQLNNQEKILKEVKDIENMIRFTIASLRAESTQTHESMIRDWSIEVREASKVVARLDTLKAKLEEEAQQRNKRYEQTKKNLQAIKNMLIERTTAEDERRQKELENRCKKLKEQDNKRRKKQGDQRGKGGDKEKKVRLKKYGQV